MRQSQGPDETESRRLTPSIGLAHDSEKPADSASNEDFLFHLYRGSELLQDNRVHEAKEELERALHLQPRDSKGQDLLAVVYFRLGLYPRAIQIYEQLRKKNTNDTALLLNLALCYLKTGQPQLARRDLELLLSRNSTHSRAWGYLGLACERLGDLAQAERAFQNGGHGQMAKRIAARRDATAPAQSEAVASSQPSREVRDVAGAAYQELDAGELSFALAEPSSEKSLEEAAAQSWRPHELGSVRPSDRAADIASVRPSPPAAVHETAKPDTKDGQRGELGSVADPPIIPSVPQLGIPQSLNRRPTLIAPVGAPPAHEYDPLGVGGGGAAASEFSQVERIPSHQPPSFSLDDAGIPAGVAAAAAAGVASMRRPVVAVPSPFGPAKSHAEQPINELHRTRTLPPPLGAPGSAPPPAAAPSDVGSASPSTPLGIGPGPGPLAPGPVSPSVKPETPRIPSGASYARGLVVEEEISEPRLSEAIRFPNAGVVLHASGVALVQTTEENGFAARLEAIRAQQSGLQMKLLERQSKGKSTGESFGGVTSPMVLATGDGQLVLAARPGRKLSAFVVGANEMCFAREDVLLGFGAALAFENGRLSTGENEFVPVVQLRGEGAVLLEAMGSVLTLPVRADRSLNVRREVILGWYGRLVPRAVAPKDAPCGQRGLVSFAGEGRVLITSA
jgi:uncharacterized protein (AIM24 family)